MTHDEMVDAIQPLRDGLGFADERIIHLRENSIPLYTCVVNNKRVFVWRANTVEEWYVEWHPRETKELSDKELYDIFIRDDLDRWDSIPAGDMLVLVGMIHQLTSGGNDDQPEIHQA